MKKSLSLLRIILWVVAVYHLALGIIGGLFPSFAVGIAATLFSFNLTLTNEIGWIAQPLSAYIFVFGVFAAVAARDPLKYSATVVVIAVLMAIRVLQIINFFLNGGDLTLDPTRLMLNTIVAIIIGVSLLFLLKKAKSQSSAR